MQRFSEDFEAMDCKRINADSCMYYCYNIYGILIWLFWIDYCLCLGHLKVVYKSKYKMKRLFDCDDVGDMEKYVGCKIDCANRSFNFTQPFMVKIFKGEFDMLNPGPLGSNHGNIQNTLLLALGYRALRGLPRCMAQGEGA